MRGEITLRVGHCFPTTSSAVTLASGVVASCCIDKAEVLGGFTVRLYGCPASFLCY